MTSLIASLYLGAAVVVLMTLLLSLLRIFRGPTPVERIMAAQLMGTAGVGVLLLMEAGLDRAGFPIAGLLDVALVFAVLAGVAGVAFVYRGWESGLTDNDKESHRDAGA
jgi:multicomponent Na+:H+ antiporter subunit F